MVFRSGFTSKILHQCNYFHKTELNENQKSSGTLYAHNCSLVEIATKKQRRC